MKKTLIILLFGFLSYSANSQFPTMDEDDLLSSILIKHTNGGAGSAFIVVDSSSNYIFLCTAAHVLGDSTKLHSDSINIIFYSRNAISGPKSILQISLKSAYQAGALKFDFKNDAVVALIGKIDPSGQTLSYTNYVKKVTTGNNKLNGWLPKRFLRISEVAIGSDMLVIGYPTSLTLTGRFDSDRPLVRKGVIAGKDYTQNRIIGDGAVYHGNSGGPVFAPKMINGFPQYYNLIGFVSELVPFYNSFIDPVTKKTALIDMKNSGYSIIVPIDFIYQLILSFPL